MENAIKNRKKYIAFIRSTGLGNDTAEDIIQNVMTTCFQRGIWNEKYIYAGIRHQIISEKNMSNRYIHCSYNENNNKSDLNKFMDKILSEIQPDVENNNYIYSKYIELIENINNRDKEIIELKLSGNTFKQIVKKTGLELNSIKTIYYKHFNKLIKYLE